MNVLVINAGSSSLKWQVIATDSGGAQGQDDVRLCRGAVERIGGEVIISTQSLHGARQKFTAPARDTKAALDHVLRWLVSDASGVPEIQGWETSMQWDIAWCTAEKCSTSLPSSRPTF